MKGHLLRRGEETLSNELLIWIFHRPITRHCQTGLFHSVGCHYLVFLYCQFVVKRHVCCFNVRKWTIVYQSPYRMFQWSERAISLVNSYFLKCLVFSEKYLYMNVLTFLVFGCLGYIFCTRYNYQKHAYTQKRYFII